MAVYTVYLDQVFLGNVLMNCAILWATAKISNSPARKWRFIAGAVLGASYSLLLFVPGNHFFMSVWFKTIASVIITAVVFAPLSFRKFFTCLGCFYLTSFTLGGLIFGMIFFVHSSRLASYNNIGSIISEHFWPGIFLGLAAFWVTGKGITTLIKKGFFENIFKMGLLIKWGSRQVKVDALMDSGNQLKDPMTKKPVVVVEYAVLKALLPVEIQTYFEEGGEPDVWKILSSLGENNYASRFSVIPFQSLGHFNGLMVGFRPDQIVIESRGRLLQAGKVVIGIYHKKIDPEGAYHALLSPDLLELA